MNSLTISRNSVRLLVVFSLLCVSSKANSQVIDWLVDGAANYVIEEAKNQLGLNNLGGRLWDAIVDADAEATIDEKAATLSDITIDRSKVNTVSGKYPGASRWTYGSGHSTLSSHIQYYLNPLANVGVSSLGNGKANSTLSAYRDSLKNSFAVSALSDVVNKQVLDSLEIMTNSTELKQLLLEDLNDAPSLIIFLNKHPEGVRVYANSRTTKLRKDPYHLYYWSVSADAHRSTLSKKDKKKLLDPRQFFFTPSENGQINIVNGTEKIGLITNPTNHPSITCFSPELMNFCAAPNATYTYQNIKMETDALGRLIRTTQTIGEMYKGKSKVKTTLSAKNASKYKSDKIHSKALELGFSKYSLPQSNFNMVYASSEIVSGLKKKLKSIQKQMPKNVDDAQIAVTLKYTTNKKYADAVDVVVDQ